MKDHVTKEELKAALRAHPEEFDMSYWAQKSPCGTAFCIGGRTLLLAGGYEVKPDTDSIRELFDFYKDGKYIADVEQEAMSLLGVESVEYTWFPLFHKGDWPSHLIRAYEGTETPAARVEIACQAIDYFIP